MFSKFHKIFDSLTALERQIFEGAALVFIFSSVLNGVNIFYQKTILAPIQGGSFTEGLIGQPISINPLSASGNDVDRDLMELIFSDLAELIEDYKLSPDSKIWTVELKSDLRWSDGEPLTADDVIFTIETIQNPETHSPLVGTWQGITAERMSDREIRFNLKSPYAFFLDNLKTLKIVPQHIWGAIPGANIRLSDYNLEPVGSGPYMFARYEKRKDGFIREYHLEANPNFWGEQALIQDLGFKFFSNYEEAIDAFNKRKIDGLGGLAADDVPELKVGHQIKEINVPRYYAVFLNPATAPALKNKEVRSALNLSTDRAKIVELALTGKAVPIFGPIYPGLEGYEGELLNTAKFSLEDAQKILTDNKWNPGEQGIRSRKTGQEELKLEFQIVVPEIDFLVKTVEILKEDWQKIGVGLETLILSPAEIAAEIIKTRNYQMIVFGNILKNNPDIFSFWHSSERFHPGLNLALYENRTVDGLLESIRRNFDTDARIRDIKKLQNIINDDEPAVFLFSPNYLYAGSKDLGGFEAKFITTPANRFDEVFKWFLKTARVFK